MSAERLLRECFALINATWPDSSISSTRYPQELAKRIAVLLAAPQPGREAVIEARTIEYLTHHLGWIETHAQQAMKLIRALASSPESQEAKDAYVRVPREATQEWMDNFANGIGVTDASARAIHSAMLAALEREERKP